jgi:hypothetical protein
MYISVICQLRVAKILVFRRRGVLGGLGTGDWAGDYAGGIVLEIQIV